MEGESRSIEYRREISELRKITQTVIAFANGCGGKIKKSGADPKTRYFFILSTHISASGLYLIPDLL
jgi:hypothetical protein